MRTNPNSNPLVLLRALQKLWPLAKCSVQENALDGTVEAEIIVPRERDERERAFDRARKSRISEVLMLLCLALLFLALVTYANDCYLSLSEYWASTAAPAAAGDEASRDTGKSEL